jgi:hypothetical protein
VIALQLLLVLTWFLAAAAVCGLIALVIDWWQMRRPLRVPPPPLSNDQRVRAYQENERAYRGLRNG